MRTGKLIAISDVHLDTWERGEPDSYAEKRRAFLSFLDWVRDGSGARHFAIVGDLMDIPRPDHEPILPLFQDIANALAKLLRAGIQVHYLSGNHDAGLIGIEVAMTRPALHVGPHTRIDCGAGGVWLEHGHLMDAWLWEHVQRKSASVAKVPAPAAMAHFLRCSPGGISTTPATVYVHETLYHALQWQALETGFTDDEKRSGLRVMSQHLDDDFADVAAGGGLPPHHEEIHERLRSLGLSVADLQGEKSLPPEALDLFAPTGYRYYSPYPWRRAARCRLSELRASCEGPLLGLVMGHIHCPDRYTWQASGTELVYVNCGTWSGANGSYVSVEGDRIAVHQRHWAAPLP